MLGIRRESGHLLFLPCHNFAKEPRTFVDVRCSVITAFSAVPSGYLAYLHEGPCNVVPLEHSNPCLGVLVGVSARS